MKKPLGGHWPEAGWAQKTGRRPMLYLTRKIGESVIINDNIEVTVVDIRGKSIKLGFTFPPEATVLRRELYERIQAENRAAAAAGGDAVVLALGGDSKKPNDDKG